MSSKRISFYIFSVLIILNTLCTYAQVTVGLGSPPVEGAILQLKQRDNIGANSTKGLALPRVSLTDLNNLFPMFTDNGAGGYNEGVKADQDAMHIGLTVYNVNTVGCIIRQGVFTWEGDKWIQLGKPVDDDVSGFSFDRERDSLALVALYNNTGGLEWTNKTNWLSSRPITEWYGVSYIEKCLNGKAELAVTGIHFENNNLVGTLPEDLKNIVNLTHLSLPVSQLTGNLPVWLSQLTKLQIIDFRSNQLSGPIPTELENLANLRALDLQGNELTGTIPSTIGNLTKLKYLNLAYNDQLVGGLPVELGNLTGLISLDVQHCNLSGNIPTLFGNLSNLIIFSLSGNKLEGDIPTSLLNVLNKKVCPQYKSDGTTINPNPWTNYSDPDCS